MKVSKPFKKGPLADFFYDTPAGQDGFLEIIKTSKFPFKFSAHRWIEDLTVAERAIELWPSVQKFMNYYKRFCNGEPISVPYLIA